MMSEICRQSGGAATERHIADGEVSAALSKLSAGKAAGLDGIPVEFFK